MSVFDDYDLKDIPGLLESIARQDGWFTQREANKVFAAALSILVEKELVPSKVETEEPDPVSAVRKANRRRKSNSEASSEGAS